MGRFPGFLAVVVVAVAACSSGGSGNVTGPSNGTPGMSASINGAAWQSAGPSAIYSHQILSIAGLNLSYGIGIAVGQLTTTGTYSLAYGNQNAGSATVSNTTSGWGTGFPGGTGTITVTTLDATHVVGTFAFDAVPASGSGTGTVRVTNGQFNIAF
ncbi:MAG: hypothetical protein ACRELE_00130 [Gemmatimonadales bacterium]